MKKFTLSLTLMMVITSIIYSQTPQAIDYQAVVRDAGGAVLNSANVGVRVSILQESAFGTAVYVETHNVTTSQLGLINIAIGDGVVGSGDFSLIDWAGSLHFVKVEIDDTGGANYVEMGTSQLLSAPYSLQAAALTLTDVNGTKYTITVDTLGNLMTIPINP
ncbi:MAG: hypothetical protein KAG99_05070 [Bacteroidales bacterium]|nr:hypothetical protein [Bacteroidales bacterium]